MGFSLIENKQEVNVAVTDRYAGYNSTVISATDSWGCASIPFGMRSAGGKIYNVKRESQSLPGAVFQLFVSDDGLRWKTDFNFFGGIAHKARVIDDEYYVFTTLGVCYKAVNDSLVELSFNATDMVKFGSLYVRLSEGKVYTSPDLNTWTLRTGTYGTPKSCDVVGTNLVLVPELNNICYRTTDFTTYTSATLPYSATTLANGSAYTVNGILIIPTYSTVSYVFTTDGASFTNSSMTMLNSPFTIDYYAGKYVVSLFSQGDRAIFGYADSLSSSFTEAYLGSNDYSLALTAMRGSLCIHNNTLVAQKDGFYSYVKTDTTFVSGINSYANAGLTLDNGFSGAPFFDEDLDGKRYAIVWNYQISPNNYRQQFFALEDEDGYYRIVKDSAGSSFYYSMTTQQSTAVGLYNKGFIATARFDSSVTSTLVRVTDYKASASLGNWAGGMTAGYFHGLIKLHNGFAAVPQSTSTTARFVNFSAKTTDINVSPAPIRMSMLKGGFVVTDSASSKKYYSYNGSVVNIKVFDASFADVSALNFPYVASDGLYAAGIYVGTNPITLKTSNNSIPTVLTSSALEHNHGICIGDKAIIYRKGDSFDVIPVDHSANMYSCMGTVSKLDDGRVLICKPNNTTFGASTIIILEKQ